LSIKKNAERRKLAERRKKIKKAREITRAVKSHATVKTGQNWQRMRLSDCRTKHGERGVPSICVRRVRRAFR
jgi:hypothetical protein